MYHAEPVVCMYVCLGMYLCMCACTYAYLYAYMYMCIYAWLCVVQVAIFKANPDTPCIEMAKKRSSVEHELSC